VDRQISGELCDEPARKVINVDKADQIKNKRLTDLGARGADKRPESFIVERQLLRLQALRCR
jgi:hypothetical protein